MSFSATVKEELCRLDLGKSCCMLSELAALYRTSGALTFHGLGRVQVQYRVENTALARRIFRLLTARLSITPRLHYVQHARLGGQRTCVLTIGDEDSKRLMLALHLIEQGEDGSISYRRTIVRHHLTRQCCRRAYLRAAFLGAGTMSAPEKDYHFEITASETGFVRELTRVLEKAELPVHTFERKEQTVIYLKGAQQISDCLALMGASASVFALENVRIRKQARGAANRAINCDEHNSEKMLNAAMQQVNAIRWYTIAHGLRELPPALQEIARLRLENVDLSLTELGNQLQPPLSKSAVNHRMRRLMEIIREAEEQARKEAAAQAPDR
jgi:cell division protein WhiA